MKKRVESLEELHTLFCAAAQRPEPFDYWEGDWQRLLAAKEYRGDLLKLQRDTSFVVAYLRGAISRDKRNPGALRPRNLLQPAQFASDLAEAIQHTGKKRWQDHCRAYERQAAGAVVPQVSEPAVLQASSLQTAADTDAIAKQGAAALRAWRESQLGK